MGNALSKIFPPYLTLVVNYPLLLGALLNISLVSPRLVTINLLYQTFFVIIYRSLKSTVLYRAGLVLYGLMSLSESLHWTILKGPLTLSSLLAISATHLQESIDFWGLKASLGPLLVLPLLFLLHKAWKHRPDFSPLPHSPLVQSLLALVFIGFIWENAHAGRLVRKGVPHFIKVAITFQQEMELFRHAKEKGTIQPTEARATAKEQTVVLVIGESSNRNHWQLYGCAWPTTPRLSARHDLYVFNNVVSAHSSTIPSVLSSLRGNTPENARPAEVRDLFDVFGSAGYTTYWISNQVPVGVWENPITVLGSKSDHPIFVNLGSSSSMEATLTRSYDELLFGPTLEALQAADPLKLIVLHTMGSHSSYKKRYPMGFDHFKGTDKRSQTIAEYRNSILYTDFVLDSLLNLIDQNSNNAVVIYTSDHGQNVYDDGDESGHSYAGSLPRSIVEIPYFYWFSADYGNEIDTALIRSRQSSPYVTDNLFHTLIDLARIETPVFDPRLSFIHPGFDASRKRILEDGRDYDEAAR